MMKINSPEFAQWASDNTIRIEKIIPLSAIGNGSLPDTLRDWLEECDAETFERTFGTGSWRDADVYEEGEVGDDSFVEYITENALLGFMVRAERPVRKYCEGGTSSFSWGHYSTAMIYVADLDELQPKLAEWAAAREATERARVAKK